MRSGFKCCTMIEKDENGEETRISCHQNVTGEFYQSCFCVEVGEETRLKLLWLLRCEWSWEATPFWRNSLDVNKLLYYQIKTHFNANIYFDLLEDLGRPSPIIIVRVFPPGLSWAISPWPLWKTTILEPPPPQPSFFTLNSSLKNRRGLSEAMLFLLPWVSEHFVLPYLSEKEMASFLWVTSS